MSNSPIIQFLGYEVHPLDREYRFSVRESNTDAREFIVKIANAAFDSHRSRFQDAPDICSLRLRRELGAHENHPVESCFQITDEELEEYRARHFPKTSQSPFKKKPVEDY
jgi:hypothetical protein